MATSIDKKVENIAEKEAEETSYRRPYYYDEKPSLKVRIASAIGNGLLTGAKKGAKLPIVFAKKIGRKIKKRMYNVAPQEFAILLNREYKLVRGELEEFELMNMINMGVSPDKIYKEKRDLFVRGAKIQGPRKISYFRWPFQSPLRIQTKTFMIDPPPTEETINFHGLPIKFLVDTKVIYTIDPVLFVLKNSGEFVSGYDDWQERLNDKLIAETGELVHEHFQRYQCKFPDVCLYPIDSFKATAKRRSLLEKYGVSAEIKIEKCRPVEGQERVMQEILTARTADSSSVDSFLEIARKIQEVTGRNRYNADFYALLEGFNKYRNDDSKKQMN